jgi:fructokinase
MIVVCGEALIDLVPDIDRPGDDQRYLARPGGSPTNVAVGLGRLGVDVRLVTRLAGDHFGRLLRDHLAGSNVDLRWAVSAPEPSTLAVVSLDAAGLAEYAFYVTGAADGGWTGADLPPNLPEGAALHVSGSLALGLPSMGDTFEVLLEREHGQRVVTLDPNVRPPIDGDDDGLRSRLDRWLGLVDVVKVSADDLAWLAPDEPVTAVAARWLERGPSLVVVTLGPKGALAVGRAGSAELPGVALTVADTVGAGDAFMSGLLAAFHTAGLLSRDGLATVDTAAVTGALTFAQRVATITCTRVGADPPWRHELDPG